MSKIYEDWESLKFLKRGDIVQVGDKLVVAGGSIGFDPGAIVTVTSVNGDHFWIGDESDPDGWIADIPFARLPDNNRTIKYHFFENSVFAECGDGTIYVINNEPEEFVWNKLPPVPSEQGNE